MKVIGFIAIIIIVLTLTLSRYGLFETVTITEKDTGPYLLVYEKHIGDYKNVAPVMDKLYYDLKDNYEIETTKGFGLYYDNPQVVDADKLRSIVGCIVEGKSPEDLKNIAQKYKVKEYPASKSVYAEFPFAGKISIIMGIVKVYPKLSEYIAEKGYAHTPVMELYDKKNGKIEYMSSVNLSGNVFDEFIK